MLVMAHNGAMHDANLVQATKAFHDGTYVLFKVAIKFPEELREVAPFHVLKDQVVGDTRGAIVV